MGTPAKIRKVKIMTKETIEEKRRVRDLDYGDRVDLQGDAIADNGEHPEFEFEYERVLVIQRETKNCYVIEFESGFTCGFPIDHEVTVSTELTPVIFRRERRKDGDVTAVFFCERDYPNDPGLMTCYAHIGQHGSCGLGWYNKTRPALPHEYGDLKAELESSPYFYRFRIYKRMNRKVMERHEVR
jgi:hypothetical protein